MIIISLWNPNYSFKIMTFQIFTFIINSWYQNGLLLTKCAGLFSSVSGNGFVENRDRSIDIVVDFLSQEQIFLKHNKHGPNITKNPTSHINKQMIVIMVIILIRTSDEELKIKLKLVFRQRKKLSSCLFSYLYP